MGSLELLLDLEIVLQQNLHVVLLVGQHDGEPFLLVEQLLQHLNKNGMYVCIGTALHAALPQCQVLTAQLSHLPVGLLLADHQLLDVLTQRVELIVLLQLPDLQNLLAPAPKSTGHARPDEMGHASQSNKLGVA